MKLFSFSGKSNQDRLIPIGAQGRKPRFIEEEQKRQHMFLIGSTRSGKSHLILHLALWEMRNQRAFGVLDPHTDLFQALLTQAYIQDFPKERLLIIDSVQPQRTPSLNPLEVGEGEDLYSLASELLGAFKRVWAEGPAAISGWGPRMEDLLRMSLLALMEKGGTTLLDLPLFLSDADFRGSILADVDDPTITDFWEKTFERLPKREQAVWVEPIRNKINSVITNPYLRDLLGQPQSTISFQEILNHGKMVMLVNLAKGVLKRDNAFLLGALILAKLTEAALARCQLPQDKRHPFTLYVDEAGSLASTKSLDEILTETAKYGLSLCLVTQTLSQIPQDLKRLILGNTALQVVFRVSRSDAEELAPQMFAIDPQRIKHQTFKDKGLLGPVEPQGHPLFFSPQEQHEENYQKLVALKPRQAYVNLSFSDQEPFLIRTLETPNKPLPQEILAEYEEEIIAPYTCPREEVRREIAERLKALEPQEPPYKQDYDPQRENSQTE